MLILTDNIFSDEDLSLCKQAEEYLGGEICDFEFIEAKQSAKRKLFDWIIPREGDLGGARREPWYLAKLIQEAVSQDRLSEFCRSKFETSTDIPRNGRGTSTELFPTSKVPRKLSKRVITQSI